MPSERVYRDYTSGEESSNCNRATLSKKHTSPVRVSPPRIVIAPTEDEQKVPQAVLSASNSASRPAGVADEISSEQSGDLDEPNFDEIDPAIPPSWNDSAKPLPSMPSEAQKGRDRNPVRSPPPTSPPRNILTSPSRGSERPMPLSSSDIDHMNGTRLDASRDLVTTKGASPESMPQFFSWTTFHTALHSPTITHQLLKFGQSRLCGESIEFLLRIHRYHALLQEVTKAITDVHTEFLADGATSQINIPHNVLIKANGDIKNSLSSAIPKLESIFGAAQADIEQLVYGDVYPGFVRRQLGLSAAAALGGNRLKFGGLGDCFVLTDPSKADNPIVFVSDGFIKVTGYPRKEIIPRNCRFLQSPQTDRVVVNRIRTAIEKRQESVELLLNQRKNGEPFWNLLYTTPLFDGDGKLIFFLGGQINCSTTVHSTSDVLRVLARTDERASESPKERSDPVRLKPSKSRAIFRGSNSKPEIQEGAPGMEDGLVEKLESLPLPSQMRSFYTAYSNFIIINYSTFLIAFVSTGIVEMLVPIKAKTTNHAAAAGLDIFKFLANHGSGSLGWDFKSAVKEALKAGQAISLDVKLCAKPSMGFEKFMCHWTPLKDDKGAVTWIVLTLGSKQGR